MTSRQSVLQQKQARKKVIQLSLVDNALDFLESSVREVRVKKSSHKKYKYGLLHLSDGIELMLKARLQAEHWTLVIAGNEKTTREKFKTGDFKSVEWGDAIYRVQHYTNSTITEEDVRILKNLRAFRNRIQHFELNVERDEATARLAEGLEFALRFFQKNLKIGLAAEYRLQLMQEALTSFSEFIHQRLRTLGPRLAARTKIAELVPCPRCKQKTLYASKGESKCLYCEAEASGNVAAYEYTMAFGAFVQRDGELDNDIGDCPICGAANTLVQVGFYSALGHDKDFCFFCGSWSEYELCQLCGKRFHGSDAQSVCNSCLSQRVDSDPF